MSYYAKSVSRGQINLGDNPTSGSSGDPSGSASSASIVSTHIHSSSTAVSNVEFANGKSAGYMGGGGWWNPESANGKISPVNFRVVEDDDTSSENVLVEDIFGKAAGVKHR